MKTILTVCLLALAGCAAAPVVPVATVPLKQSVTDVRYVPIRPDLTAPVQAPAPGVSFGGLWQEAQGWRAVAKAVNARLACIAAIQSASAASAFVCPVSDAETQP